MLTPSLQWGSYYAVTLVRLGLARMAHAIEACVVSETSGSCRRKILSECGIRLTSRMGPGRVQHLSAFPKIIKPKKSLVTEFTENNHWIGYPVRITHSVSMCRTVTL
jgi:hypothetical protein